MRDCPDERTLERLYVGEGRAAQRRHVASCPECAGRMRRIDRDLEQIREVLFEDPPLELIRRRAFPPARSLLGALALGAAAAACAAALLWTRPPGVLQPLESPAELAGFVHTASQAVFPTLEEDASAVANPRAVQLAALGAALTGGRPCTAEDQLDTNSCDVQDVTTLAQGW
ncbi:MAG TPA: hypothetical protein VEG67_06890 [Myxococcota bacterium]|nr:hypothetical protein [Myxococcota bacterium]